MTPAEIDSELAETNYSKWYAHLDVWVYRQWKGRLRVVRRLRQSLRAIFIQQHSIAFVVQSLLTGLAHTAV